MNISLIIPVYNVEKYLSKCLDSVANQTTTGFELILVDDGSTDGSGKICDKYASNHSNTKVIHQQNQGLSMARNNAVNICMGDYVTFVDSDDYISPDYIEYLKNIVDQKNVDIAIGNHLRVWDDFAESHQNNDDIRVMSASTAIEALLYEKEFSSIAVAKLYRKDLLINHPYPQGILYEDMATTYKIVGDSNTIGVGKKIIYYWRQRKNSITSQKITQKHLDALKTCEDIIAYTQNRFPSAVSAAEYKYAAKVCMYMPYTMKDKNGKRIFAYLKRQGKPYLKKVIKDKKARTDTKIRCAGILLGYHATKAITYMAEFVKPLRTKQLLMKSK